MDKSEYKEDKTKNSNRSKAIQQGSWIFNKLSSKALKQHGFAKIRIITDWPLIVGKDFAAISCPYRIVFPGEKQKNGNLHIAVLSGYALLMQHQSNLIIEKISSYFGYQAISRITILQRSHLPGLAKPAIPVAKPKLTAEQQQQLDTELSAIEDDELKAILANIGRSVITNYK